MSKAETLTIGRSWGRTVNAVEGLQLSDRMLASLDNFQEAGLSADEQAKRTIEMIQQSARSIK